MTKLIKTIEELHKELESLPKPVGLVPTMGALHNGHISLIKAASEECKTVIVYVFVNPLQFAPNEDYKEYPRDLDRDLKKCQENNVHILFAPPVEEVYQDESNKALVEVPYNLSSILCGKTRRNHFSGVATVIKRFIELIKPENIYFGQKDYQQVHVIKWLVKNFQFPTIVRECPIVREDSGLALSSRNKRLKGDQKEIALNLYKSLNYAKQNMKTGIFTPGKAILESIVFLSNVKGLEVEYFEARKNEDLSEVSDKERKNFRFFIAAKVGDVRLIDNIEV